MSRAAQNPAGNRDAAMAALRLAAVFALAKLLLQFALTLWTTHLGYSWFRDEFYYIACGRHLAWGYVDHGPIVAVQARVGELLFGDSVFGVRVLSAVAGALTVGLGGVLCWALGGRRPAQALACLALLVTPQYIGVDGFLSMNSCEAVFWSVCVLALVQLLRGAPAWRWWLVLGVSAGVGLLNKPSMAVFLVALGTGLLCTPQRRALLSRQAAVGVGLLLLVVLPNVLWQAHHGWPTAEFLHNGRAAGKNVVLGPLQFVLAQVLNMHPLNALLWVPGVVALLRGRSIRGARWLGVAFVVFFVLMYAAHAKDYYLEGAYPAFFAAGAVAWEHRFASRPAVQRGRLWAFPVYEALLVLTGVLVLPMSSPVLRPATWVRYTSALHLHTQPTETSSSGPLPQFFADRLGWDEQYRIVASAFHALPAADRARLCIFGSNYGEAGNVDFRNRLLHDGLPPALSGHNSYWGWGTHGCDPDVVIAIVPDTPAKLEAKYRSVTVLGRNTDPYSMPFERRNVYLLRGRREPLRWEDERFYY